jgi:hypothetical protein
LRASGFRLRQERHKCIGFREDFGTVFIIGLVELDSLSSTESHDHIVAACGAEAGEGPEDVRKEIRVKGP